MIMVAAVRPAPGYAATARHDTISAFSDICIYLIFERTKYGQ